MTTFAFPTLTRVAPGSLQWSLRSNTMSHTSPLTSATQTVEMPGARWEMSFSMDNLTEPDAAALQAFLVRLRGQANRFTLYNFARPTPRGTLTGTPLVNGAGQSGATLAIDGCTVGATLLAGDFIGVNGELKMVVADATANGSGQMSLSIEPPLRASPADNAPLTLVRPTATFMLSESTAQWSTHAPVITSVPIQAVENWN